MRWRAALVVVAFAAGAAAAEPVVTLEDASARALATHEEIRAAEADRERAAVAPWRAVSAMGPNLTEIGSYTRNREEISFPLGTASIPGFNPVVIAQDVLRSRFELSQPIYTHQVWALRDIGKAEVARSDDAYRAARQDVLVAVASAYYDALRAQTLERVARETQHLADTEIAHAQARVDLGEAVRTDVLRAQTTRTRADQRLAEATGDLETALDRLRRLARLEGSFTVTEPTTQHPAPGDVEPLLATARAHNPDLHQREAQLAVARGEERRRVAELYPTLGMQFDYQNLNNESFADRNAFWTLMVRAQVPIFEQGGARWLDIAEQRAVVSRLEAQVAGFRRDLELDVRRAWVSARTLRVQRTAGEQEVRLASESYAMLSEQYAAGVATNLDVLTALTTLSQARATLATIRYAEAVTLVQLDRAEGTLGEDAP